MPIQPKKFNLNYFISYLNLTVSLIPNYFVIILYCITEPLQILFVSLLEKGVYLNDWKKSNAVPIHKKESKHLISRNQDIAATTIKQHKTTRKKQNLSTYKCRLNDEKSTTYVIIAISKIVL